MRNVCLVETFENRRHLSSATATFSAGILKVYGTTGDDELTVSLNNTQVVVTWVDKTGTTPQTRTIKSVARSALRNIRLFARDGNDKARVLVDIPSVMHGGLGNDTIESAGANDTIYANQGNDQISAGNGNDIVYGGDGNDHIRGGNGNDQLCGRGNNDTIFGNFGNDTLYGGAGNDELRGGLGDDSINTGPMTGLAEYDIAGASAPGSTGVSHDSIRGGQGNDTILARRSDTVLGCAGRDAFRSTSSWPTLSDFSTQDDSKRIVSPIVLNPPSTMLPVRPWHSGAMAVLFRMARHS